MPTPAASQIPIALRRERGQASVEFVVLLPVLLAVLAVGYQAILAGQAVWATRVAARAAARAHSLGADPAAAARAHLSPGLERGLRVSSGDAGEVRVSVRVPTVLSAVRLGRVSARSHFQAQNE
jgi:pilus assembly protein CpaE